MHVRGAVPEKTLSVSGVGKIHFWQASAAAGLAVAPQQYMPPLTARICPVMYAALSDAKKAAASATS